ncbi:unnamed protein product, partial [Pleuronectes platessa]
MLTSSWPPSPHLLCATAQPLLHTLSPPSLLQTSLIFPPMPCLAKLSKGQALLRSASLGCLTKAKLSLSRRL